MNGVRVVLTPIEQMIARWVNDERTKYNTRREVVCQKFSDRVGIELDGYGAELAVARHFNLYPDFCIDKPGKVDDLTTRKGEIIDVKNYSRIQIPERHKPVDYFVFVRGSIPNYEILGWVEYGKVVRPEYLKPAKFNHSYQPPEDVVRQSGSKPHGGVTSLFQYHCGCGNVCGRDQCSHG
jgi:hypothetical protein